MSSGLGIVRQKEGAMKQLLLIVLLLVSVIELTAEEISDIKPGTRVRLKTHSARSWIESKHGTRVWLHGARVRLKTHPDSRWVEGTVVALDADTLVLRRRKETPYPGYVEADWASRRIPKSVVEERVEIPLSSITKFEFELEGGRYSEGTIALTGCIGFGVGTGFGVGVWALIASDGHFQEAPPSFAYVVLGSIIGAGALGAILGVVISSNVGDWEPVPLPVRVSLMPHGGVQVAVSFEFGR